MRDYIGYGFSRIMLLLMVSTSYVILYFAESGETDTLLYAWTLQYGGEKFWNTFESIYFN